MSIALASSAKLWARGRWLRTLGNSGTPSGSRGDVLYAIRHSTTGDATLGRTTLSLAQKQ